jgi:ATP phosphoribosyltransferase regulatory subunit
MRLERAIPAAALEAIRAPFATTGAVLTDAPVLQPLGLLLDLAGEAMRSRLFVVSGDGGDEACLRPDFTVAIARAHIEAGAATGRYLYDGKAFRVAPRGSDRAEEFLQIGVEAFEAGDPVEADAEIAALAWASAVAGGRSDLSLLLGDVGLFGAFIDTLDLAAPLAVRLKRAFTRPRQLKAELDGGPAEVSGEQSRIAALLAGLPEGEASAVLQELWSLAGRGGQGRQAVARPGRQGPSLPGGQRPPGRGLGRHLGPGWAQARGVGPGAERLAQASGRHGRPRRGRGPHAPDRRVRPSFRLL